MCWYFCRQRSSGNRKTTFLQTVIANRLAHNILNNPEEPEIIVASSANNQAITNILKDFKAETTNDTTHPRLSNRWLPELDTLGLYLSGKKSCNNSTKWCSTPKGMDFRQHTIHLNVKKSTNNSICNASITFSRKTIKTKQNAGNFSVKKCKPSKKDYSLYPSCRNNRIRKPEGKQYITEVYPQIPWAITLLWQSNRTVDFDRRIQRTLRKISSNPEYGNLPYTEDMAVRLDISYRYQMFWYAIHYREAEFIHRLSKCDEGKQRTQEAYTQRLKRLACVMPVFISTFHSLPKYMTYAENGNGIFLYTME